MPYVPRLYRTRELGHVNRSTDEFRSHAIDGALVRVRPGVYALADDWDRAHSEGIAIALAVAVTMTAATPPVVSHETAAAKHGLPLFRSERGKAHITLDDARPGAAVGTIRHRGRLREDEIVTIDGIRVTSLARTVADVCRTARFESAVVVADAALRKVAVRGMQEYDHDCAEVFRAEVREIAERSAHGVSRARRALRFADGRAQLPGESISRIRLVELGFTRLRLQVSVPGPAGKSYFVDFGCEEPAASWFGEFDGDIKYAEAAMRGGRTVEEVLDAQRKREEWIQRRTGTPLARWGWGHISTSAALGSRLLACGIRAPR